MGTAGQNTGLVTTQSQCTLQAACTDLELEVEGLSSQPQNSEASAEGKCKSFFGFPYGTYTGTIVQSFTNNQIPVELTYDKRGMIVNYPTMQCGNTLPIVPTVTSPTSMEWNERIEYDEEGWCAIGGRVSLTTVSDDKWELFWVGSDTTPSGVGSILLTEPLCSGENADGGDDSNTAINEGGAVIEDDENEMVDPDMEEEGPTPTEEESEMVNSDLEEENKDKNDKDEDEEDEDEDEDEEDKEEDKEDNKEEEEEEEEEEEQEEQEQVGEDAVDEEEIEENGEDIEGEDDGEEEDEDEDGEDEDEDEEDRTTAPTSALTPEATGNPASSNCQDDSGVAYGTFEGILAQSDNSNTYGVFVNYGPDGVTVDYPAFSCGNVQPLVPVTLPGMMEWTETLDYGARTCEGGGQVTLTQMTDTQWDFTWVGRGNGNGRVTISGELDFDPLC